VKNPLVRYLVVSLLVACGHSAPDASLDAANCGAKCDDPNSDGGTFAPAPHLAWPQLPDHGGPRLTPLRVVTVMAVDEPYAAQLTAFGDALVQSAWLASWAPEYNVATTATHLVVTGPHVAPGTAYTQDMMNAYIMNAVQAASPSPIGDGKTVYVLYLPPGTVIDNFGTPDTTCARAPYHTDYGATGDAMAVLNRCPSGFASQVEMFEVVAAHEIAEAATDPLWDSQPAWVMSDANAPYQESIWTEEEIAGIVENGDLCLLTRIQEGDVEYQRIFSNVAAQQGGDPCVPALSIPFYNVSPDPATNGWIAVTPGQTVDVPLSSWSTASTEDWIVTAHGTGWQGGHFAAKLTSPTTTSIGAFVYNTTNNGRALTLHVTLSANVAPGWWGVVQIWSAHRDAAGNPLPGEDIDHEGLVGFYVPS
jgi:hypothetical protein